MAQTTGDMPKIYFYYPPVSEKDTRRRVLAGVVENNTLFVAQSTCFGGVTPCLIPVKLRNGTITHIIDPGVAPDMFNKIEGRNLAIRRLGIYQEPKTGNVVRFKKDTILEVTLPEGDVNPGKFFVESVEAYLKAKGLPIRPKKNKAGDSGEPPVSSCV